MLAREGGPSARPCSWRRSNLPGTHSAPRHLSGRQPLAVSRPFLTGPGERQNREGYLNETDRRGRARRQPAARHIVGDQERYARSMGRLPRRNRTHPLTSLAVQRRVLAVRAHPDGTEFGAGTTMAKWTSVPLAGLRLRGIEVVRTTLIRCSERSADYRYPNWCDATAAAFRTDRESPDRSDPKRDFAPATETAATTDWVRSRIGADIETTPNSDSSRLNA